MGRGVFDLAAGGSSRYRLPVPPRTPLRLVEISASRKSAIRRKLLAWYEVNKRSLPWRDAPSPYAVWVSEVMLQQTRVEVVKAYFARWMEKFPSVRALADSSEDDVLKIWQGLGYYSRAKRLRSGARYLVREQGGELPSSVEELLTVPGIGPYSAGAISSIAFQVSSPLVDGNVIRVLSRWFSLKGDPNKAPLKKELWRLAGELVPSDVPGDFNQGLMELGATLCSPKTPSCVSCPMSSICRAFQEGEVSRYPELPKRAKPTALTFSLILLRHRGRYAVQKLDADARWWAGLDAFPFFEVAKRSAAEADARSWAERVARVQTNAPAWYLPTVRHSVTRYRIELVPVVLSVRERERNAGGYRWIPWAALDELALPAPHRKALASLEKWEHAGRPSRGYR